MTTTNATTETFRSEPTFIREYRLEQLDAVLMQISKRARKLNVAAPTRELTGNERIDTKTIAGSEVKIRSVEVIVTGETPKFPGWKLIAVVSHEDGIVDVVPGESCPADQRDRGTICDHCNRNITSRKKTMVLRKDDDGSVVQVGTTCIGDFLGTLKFDPQLALAYLTQIMSVLEGCGGMDNEDLDGTDSPDGYGGGGRQTFVEDMETILNWTAGWLVDNPWISGGKAYETHSTATKSHVIDLIWAPRFTGKYAAEQRAQYQAAKDRAQDAITEDRKAEVKAALKWVQEAAAADEDNDYLAACATLAANGHAAGRRFGYACSILTSYRRHVDGEEAKRERKPDVNEHVGTVGDRLTLDVRMVADVRPIDSDFGTSYLHTFKDAGGRIFKTFASHRLADNRGATLVIKGTVKKHGEWQDSKETTLSRCAIIVAGEGAAMDAARELLAGDVSRPADDPAMLELDTAVKFMKRAKVWRLK